jgi:hypothetical protein
LKLRVSGGSAAQDLLQAQAFELKAHLKNYLKNGFFTEFYKKFSTLI